MGIEHVFIEYDPTKPTNRFELGTRKLVRSIELTNVEGTAPALAPAPAPASDTTALAPTILDFYSNATTELPYPSSVNLTAIFPRGTGVVTPGALPIVTGGSVSVTPPRGVTVYTLTVTHNNATVTRTHTLYVMPAIPPSITSFSRSGGNTSLYVTANTSVTLTAVFDHGSDRQGSPFARITPGDVDILSNGTATIPVTTPSSQTYTLLVENLNTNVGIARSLTITVVALPSIVSFTRTDSANLYVEWDEMVTLSATFTGGSGQILLSGTVVDTILPNISKNVEVSPGTYTLRVTNPAGDFTEMPITFLQLPNPQITNFSRTANNVAPYTTVTLSVSFTGGTARIMPGNHSFTTNGSVDVTPSVTTTYTLSLYNVNGALWSSQTLTINVVIPPPTISQFYRSANDVAPHTSVALTAVFSNGTGVITPGNYTLASGGGQISVHPSTTTVYTLTVTSTYDANVSISQQLTITVIQPSFQGYQSTLSVDPTSIERGDSFTIVYTVPINVVVNLSIVSNDWQGTPLIGYYPSAVYNLTSQTTDTTSVPGARVVTLYCTQLHSLTGDFHTAYGAFQLYLVYRITGTGVDVQASQYIEGNP